MALEVCTHCEYIPVAIDDYLQTQVTTTISPVTSTDPDQDVLTPGQKGTVSLTVTNGDAATGVRLVNPVFRFKADDEAVLTLVAPGGLVYAAYKDLELTNRFSSDDQASQMYVVPVLVSAIEAGDQLKVTVTVQCLDQGSSKVVAQFFAKVDEESLFPKGHGLNHHTSAEVE